MEPSRHGLSQICPQPDWRIFPSPAALASALSARVAEKLRAAVDARGEAMLAVSGGTTPKRFFQVLSQERLPWERVTVTLVDERFVPPSSDRSNEKLVRENLMRSEATKAHFVGLYSDAPSVEAAAKSAGERLSALRLPIDAAVLGMGLDGHTASFFPDADNLSRLLQPHSEEIVLPVLARSAGEPRLTLSLGPLVEARCIVLHIEGTAKREVLQSALNTESTAPVSAVFRHSARPVEIFWAPNEDETS